jgi:formate dehydrogenase subunit beta
LSDRVTLLRDTMKKILPDVDGVIALKHGAANNVAPHLFHQERIQELDELGIWPKEPVPDTLRLIQKSYPQARLGIVCRGCEERGLIEMAKHSQINLESVTLIGLNCIEEEAHFCRCPKPYPIHAQITVGERIDGTPDPITDGFAAKSQEEKLAFWKAYFTRCIKCYGCRNICPQCFCNECTLEDDLWVVRGHLPMPMPPMYHMIRAIHMAGKCVGCRECEEACPAGIPLTIQYRLIAQDMKAMFGYETGVSLEELPPQLLALHEGEFEYTGLSY